MSLPITGRLRNIIYNKLRIRKLITWAIKWSLWPVHLVTSCCGVEFAHTAAPGFDAERLGVLPFHTMRQTNIIVVEGTITMKMAKVLRRVYDQMPEPKFVIAMGSCAAERGLFWNSYHVVHVSDVVPIDVYVPGCPPTPDALIRGFIMLQNKLKGKVGPRILPKKVDLTKILPPPPPPKPTKPEAKKPEIKEEKKEGESS